MLYRWDRLTPKYEVGRRAAGAEEGRAERGGAAAVIPETYGESRPEVLKKS
jgi:hypothetical protein